MDHTAPDYFTALAWGRNPQEAWTRLQRDIRRGARQGRLDLAIAARDGDLREFAYPAGVFQRQPHWRLTSCFVRWVLGTGVHLQPDPDDDAVNLADVGLATLVRASPRLLATALAIHQQIASPGSPTGYIAFPERDLDEAEDADPRFAEADRCHQVHGCRGQRFYLFFGWVSVAERGEALPERPIG